MTSSLAFCSPPWSHYFLNKLDINSLFFDPGLSLSSQQPSYPSLLALLPKQCNNANILYPPAPLLHALLFIPPDTFLWVALAWTPSDFSLISCEAPDKLLIGYS